MNLGTVPVIGLVTMVMKLKVICGLLLFPYLNNLCENQLSRVKRAKSIINLECKRLITIILSSVKVDTKIFIRRIFCDMTYGFQIQFT